VSHAQRRLESARRRGQFNRYQQDLEQRIRVALTAAARDHDMDPADLDAGFVDRVLGRASAYVKAGGNAREVLATAFADELREQDDS
jgi:predicted glycoside hydrolase/deacetylase ChbG (UPF0249 family)